MPNQGAWAYRRGVCAAVVEACDLRGRAVALPRHFHDEDQVTLVLAGRRRFVVDVTITILARGDTLALPAGRVHASLPEPGGVFCRNVYLPAGSIAAPGFEAALALWRASDGRDDAAFAGLVAARRGPTNPSRVLLRHGETVGDAAARACMTREGFSRAFHRQRGLPPRVYGLVTRLNAARALLRAGEAPAAAAAGAGFADQSHLGREFRRIFGVTPARFRAGSSHGFQTGGDATL